MKKRVDNSFFIELSSDYIFLKVWVKIFFTV